MNDKLAARGVGWLSLAIGLSELLAPRKLERAMGIGNGQNTTIMRSMGLREVFHGLDILTHDDPTPGVIARVAGDVLDTALLGIAATKTRRPGSFTAICAMVLGIGLIDVLLAGKLAGKKRTWRQAISR
jgi:hypothetical protein